MVIYQYYYYYYSIFVSFKHKLTLIYTIFIAFANVNILSKHDLLFFDELDLINDGLGSNSYLLLTLYFLMFLIYRIKLFLFSYYYYYYLCCFCILLPMLDIMGLYYFVQFALYVVLMSRTILDLFLISVNTTYHHVHYHYYYSICLDRYI